MISYYTSMVLLTLLLQPNRYAMYKSALVLFLIVTSNYIMATYTDYGYSFYESAVGCEVVYLILLTLTTPLHKSKLLFTVTIISLLWNLLYIITESELIQDFIYNNYEIFNIILFECLFYYCLSTTRLYLWASKYLNNIKRKFTT